MLSLTTTLTSFYSQLFTRIPYPQDDFTDRVVIVTGSNRGLGLNAAQHFHRLNASKIILAVRDTAKGLAAAANIATTNPTKPASRIDVWALDISDPNSIRAFTERAGRELLRLDAVVQNAGIQPTEWHLVNGHESTIAVNVLGATLLCLSLLPLMRASAWQTGLLSKFTFVGDEGLFHSKMRGWAPGGDLFGALNDEQLADWPDRCRVISCPTGFEVITAHERYRYTTSKYLLLITCREIARLCPLTAASPVVVGYTTPGLCDTTSVQANKATEGYHTWRLFSRSAEVGSRSLVHAVSPGLGPDAHGEIFVSSIKTR